MQPTTLTVIDVAERDVITFFFERALAPGETLLSATVTSETHRGTDATPELLLNGASQLLGNAVLQAVQGRVSGATYRLRCVAPTSAGRTLTLAALLPCQRL